MADEAAPEAKEAAPSGGKVNIIVLVLVVLNTLFIGVIGFFQKKTMDNLKNQESVHDVIKTAMKQHEAKEDQKPELGKSKEDEGKLQTIDNFTTNLAQGDGPRRYLRLSAVLKYTKESNEEEFKNRKDQIRDAIISLLNAKKPEDLLKLEGKNYLKEEIKAAVNSFLVEAQLIDVYYVGFQIN